jgi:hypothetical protein
MIKNIILLLFITGCTRNSIPLHSKMVIDSNFSTTEQDLIIHSIGQWEQATDNLIQIDLTITDNPQEYGNDTGKILQSNDKVIASDSNIVFGNTTDWFSSTTINLYTQSIDSEGADFQHIILHEFGHAVGLQHVGQGIMVPISTDQNCLDDLTLHNFCAIHDCSNKNIISDCK